MKFDFEKSGKQLGNAIGKAAEIGRKAAEGTIAGAQQWAAKVQEDNQKALLKKLNPVFPEQYKDADFAIPNIVMIVDDVVRKDIELCKGSIGWRDNQNGVEIFYLYDEAIEFSDLHFIPAPICDAIYYVDPFDRDRFIRLDCYFDKMQESRLAELQDIAYCLGAREYSVEIADTSNQKSTSSSNASGAVSILGVGKKSVNASGSQENSSEKSSKRKSVAHAEFIGEREPVPPSLKWFAHDDNVRNLVKMRCLEESESGIKVYTMEFNGSDFSTIGSNTAAKIDGAISKLSASLDFKMQNKVTEERHHKLIYRLEFK